MDVRSLLIDAREILIYRLGLKQMFPVGTRSVLYGAHCFFIHPFFVALAWWHLYGFPRDFRLWAAFFLHDLGYVGLPNMDGPEGERHVEWGAGVMHRLFDRGRYDLPLEWEEREEDLVSIRDWTGDPLDDPDWPVRGHTAMFLEGWRVVKGFCGERPDGTLYVRFRRPKPSTYWRDFCLYHSRFYAKRDGKPFSRLCVADKLSVALEPWWLYLPRVIASGEIEEYMAAASTDPVTGERRTGTKYTGEPAKSRDADLAGLSPRRRWHKRMTNYLRAWADEHRDLRSDAWTPTPNTENREADACSNP